MPDQPSVPVRLPDELVASVRRVAAAKQQTPGATLAEAWRWWWNRHGDDTVNDMHATVEAMRPSDDEQRFGGES